MPDLNRAELMGRLTFDPELRRIASGTAVTNLRMAVNRIWKDNNGEKREDKLYIDAVVWGGQAEACCNYLKKGSLVFVEGYLKMEQWDDKTTGEKRSKISVQAEKVHFLDGKGDGGGHQENRRQDDHPQQQGRSQPSRGGYVDQPQQQSRGGAPQGRGGGYAGRGPTAPMTQHEADEDIPFSRPSEFDSNEFFDDVISGPHRK